MDHDMFAGFRDSLAAQLGAAIETLRRTIQECPPELWHDPPGPTSFFRRAHHAVFFLDLDLSALPEEDYTPPEPFTKCELDYPPSPPPRVFTPAELLQLLDHARARFDATVPVMTAQRAAERYRSGWMDFSIFELHLYNMRHVQHHAAQLNLLLRQRADKAVDWVSGRDRAWQESGDVGTRPEKAF